MKKFITYLKGCLLAMTALVKKVFKKKARHQGYYLTTEDILFV
jgi:hypothetical protein